MGTQLPLDLEPSIVFHLHLPRLARSSTFPKPEFSLSTLASLGYLLWNNLRSSDSSVFQESAFAQSFIPVAFEPEVKRQAEANLPEIENLVKDLLWQGAAVLGTARVEMFKVKRQ